MSKGFAPILILVGIVVVALVVGGYLLYQNQVKPVPVVAPQPIAQPTSVPVTSPVASNSAETTNWKTYVNSKYGYSIKHPSNWKITREEYDQLTFKSLVQLTQSNPKTLNNFTIIVPVEGYSQLLSELTEVAKQYAGKTEPYVLLNRNIIAQRVEFITGAGASDFVVHVLFQGSNNAFDIEAGFLNPPDNKEVSEFNQILSTFRFTN